MVCLLLTSGCMSDVRNDDATTSSPKASAHPSATRAGDSAPAAIELTYDGPGANRGMNRFHAVLVASGTDHARLDLEVADLAPIRYVWDGRRLLVHDPEEYRPWILYEAPDEHPDALQTITSIRVEPGSRAFRADCPSAAPLGQKTILRRTALGYRCGAIHTAEYDRGARSIWLDKETGLLLDDPPMTVTAIKENPVITRSTFSTRPPEGSEVTVYAARRSAGGQVKKAPDFSLQRLDGGTARLADYAGEPLVLAFFSSDIVYDPQGEECPRCIPALLTLQRDTSAGRRPAVLAVQGGDRGKPGHPLVPAGLRLPVANDPGFDVEHAYGLSERVAFAFIGADRGIHQVIDEAATDRQLRAALDRLR